MGSPAALAVAVAERGALRQRGGTCGHLGTAAVRPGLGPPGRRAVRPLHPPGFGVGLLFFFFWCCWVGSAAERQRGAGTGVSVGAARLPSPAAARGRTRPGPDRAGVAGQHLAGGRDLGGREHLFCFAKQIAIWRYAFGFWRERGGGVMQSDDIDRVFLFAIWYLEGFRVFVEKRDPPLLSLNGWVRCYRQSPCVP